MTTQHNQPAVQHRRHQSQIDHSIWGISCELQVHTLLQGFCGHTAEMALLIT